MERVLWLYALPYDALHPVVCFDERPCFLIGEEVAPLNAKPGQVAREHYAYTKNGSACLLAAIEPMTGQRLGQVRPQRTKREYALFLKELAARYPAAKKIRLVQDNLNTHDASSLYVHPRRKLAEPEHPESGQLAQHDRASFRPWHAACQSHPETPRNQTSITRSPLPARAPGTTTIL